jgi:hypothetical protein
MHDHDNANANGLTRVPWNKGQAHWGKAAASPEACLVNQDQAADRGRMRDVAIFNLAIDSKLRGCDLVTLKVEDVAPGGYAVDRAMVRQKKTGQPVRFELTVRLVKQSTNT